nr:hypothetical protein [Tanacetum cinerariifolium]
MTLPPLYAVNDEPQPSNDAGKKDDEGVNKESIIDDQERPKNSTQDVNTVRPSINTASTNVNTVGQSISTASTNDNTEVDISNISTTYLVPSTPNTRIHNYHSLDHVWTLVDLPYGKTAIGTKWIYRNNKDERGIVVRNKARLVAQGYTQEEGIDYDEVDVKSALLYGKIEEEVYIYQPPRFEYPEFPNKVYKVEKALYGLHQAPKACQDKYVDEILKKFGFSIVKTANTPMETSKPLLKNENVEDVDFHLCRSMISSLMYLTSLRLDIMFDVCACACVRFQVTPKVSHLHAMKRIFRYLKGQPKLGLWYPKDSPFEFEAYTDSDYASASLDRKSTTGAASIVVDRRNLLVKCLENHCKTQNEMVGNDKKSAFDFVYLPIDFKDFVYVKAIMYGSFRWTSNVLG